MKVWSIAAGFAKGGKKSQSHSIIVHFLFARKLFFIDKSYNDICENPAFFVQFNFERYAANYMGPFNPEKKCYFYQRVVPPGTLMFFFSLEGTPFVSAEYDVLELPHSANSKIVKEKEKLIKNSRNSEFVTRSMKIPL